MSKKTIAVVFGSRSTEHDVSIITAISSIIRPLNLSEQYRVIPVYIAKDGQWYSDPRLGDISLYSSGKIDSFLKKQKPVALQFLPKKLNLVRGGAFSTPESIDMIFPATHGTHGEDGELMAICELANIPYVGCDVRASVIAMDKVLAKEIAVANDIPTPKFVSFTTHEYEHHAQSILNAIAKRLHYPLFVKPAHLGSSIGISRVENKQELENAIEVALHFDDKALVEQGVQNLIEVTLPIMGNESPIPALLEEPLLHTEDFFDFETKYMRGGKKGGEEKAGKRGAQGYSRIPVKLPAKLYDDAVGTALKVYKAIGCSGIARVDMLIDEKTKTIYFNEVNPLPGSLYNHNWNKAGVSNVELVTRLVTYGLERYAAKTELETVFTTSFLKQF